MKNRLFFIISLIYTFSCFAQDTMTVVDLPFKGGTFYDGRSQEDILKEIERGDEPSTNLNIKYADFFVTIYNYGAYETVVNYLEGNKPIYFEYTEKKDLDIKIDGVNQCYLIPHKDTILLNEFVFNDLSNKILKITPTINEKGIKFKLSARLYERIWQQWSRDINYEKWDTLQEKWEDISPPIEIKDSANYFFKIPEIQTLSDFSQLYEDLNLRDTLVVIEGEYDDVATIVYKNRPAHFVVDDILLRVDMYRLETLIETKYIRIVFSYGC